jgi:hypothetical protein
VRERDREIERWEIPGHAGERERERERGDTGRGRETERELGWPADFDWRRWWVGTGGQEWAMERER